MEKLVFEVKNNDFVKLGEASFNIRLSHKIDPSSFIEIFERIADNFHFSITKELYKRISIRETTWHGKKTKAEVAFVISDIVDFFIDCNFLLDKGIDIDVLFKEFRNSGNYEEFRHCCSLSFLTSTYALNGDTNIKFLGGPDFAINEIPAELKVIHQVDWERRFDEKGVDKFSSYLYEDLCYDIGQTIRNRLAEGIKQSAEMVFIDLSMKSLGSLFLAKDFDLIRNIIPQPKKHRVIFFCRMGPNVFIGREGTYSLFASYVDFDPHIWDFIKQSERKITHERIRGETKVTEKETTLIEIEGEKLKVPAGV